MIQIFENNTKWFARSLENFTSRCKNFTISLFMIYYYFQRLSIPPWKIKVCVFRQDALKEEQYFTYLEENLCPNISNNSNWTEAKSFNIQGIFSWSILRRENFYCSGILESNFGELCFPQECVRFPLYELHHILNRNLMWIPILKKYMDI